MVAVATLVLVLPMVILWQGGSVVVQVLTDFKDSCCLMMRQPISTLSVVGDEAEADKTNAAEESKRTSKTREEHLEMIDKESLVKDDEERLVMNFDEKCAYFNDFETNELISDKNDRDDKSEMNTFDLRAIKSPTCLALIAYGFCHFGGIIGFVVLLPPLVTQTVESDSLLANSTEDRVTDALAIFGGGGILGNVAMGLLLTFGPMADRHFPVFVVNNVVTLIAAGSLRVEATM